MYVTDKLNRHVLKLLTRINVSKNRRICNISVLFMIVYIMYCPLSRCGSASHKYFTCLQRLVYVVIHIDYKWKQIKVEKIYSVCIIFPVVD